MNDASRAGIDGGALGRIERRERERFTATHAESGRLARASAAHWLNAVPMHWMGDWPTPHPLFVVRARGVEVEDVYGNSTTPGTCVPEDSSRRGTPRTVPGTALPPAPNYR